MINTKHQEKILKAIEGTEYGLSLSDMFRGLNLTRDQIRIAVASLLGAEKIEEQIYGRSKVYYLA